MKLTESPKTDIEEAIPKLLPDTGSNHFLKQKDNN
jgi:hypothetical protein